MIGDMLEKGKGSVSNLNISASKDSSGAVKRKFAEDSNTDEQDAKVRKTEEDPDRDSSASNDDAGGWVCASCTFINHPSLEVCEMCDSSRNALVMLQMQLEEMKQRTGLVQPPSNWLPVDPGTRLSKVMLAENDVDYLNIGKVMSTFGFQPSSILSSITKMFKSRSRPLYTIKKVERIENLHLYQMYMVKKAQMEEENGPLVQNEQMLWHGTTSDCVDSIATYGFNRSHCGKNGTAIGKGVYFSTGPCYSATFALPDRNRLQYMFYSRVLTGRHTIGHETMVEPPMFVNRLGRFNSLSNHMEQPNMFVIFHDAQVYPEFLITFTSN